MFFIVECRFRMEHNGKALRKWGTFRSVHPGNVLLNLLLKVDDLFYC